MLLEELFDYKNKIMKMFCENDEVVKLVAHIDDADDIDGLTLAYSRIYPFEYVPETVKEDDTFICFDVDIPDVESEVIYHPVIYIWMFTHKDTLRLDKGGVRTDMLAAEIDKMLNGNRTLGLGELDLRSVTRFAPIKDFQGRVLVYEGKDTNRWGVHKKAPMRRR